MQKQEVSAFHIFSLGSFAPAEKGQMLRRIPMTWYDDGANLAWPNVLVVGGVAGMAHMAALTAGPWRKASPLERMDHEYFERRTAIPWDGELCSQAYGRSRIGKMP